MQTFSDQLTCNTFYFICIFVQSTILTVFLSTSGKPRTVAYLAIANAVSPIIVTYVLIV